MIEEERVTVLRWQSAMQLGIPAIDADHKKLVGLLNCLHYTVMAGDDWCGVAGVLDQLVDYTEVHFAREEQLMERSDYPDFAAHQAGHRRLAEMMRKRRQAFRDSPETFDMDGFYDFVSGWLLHHVLGDDMKLRPYLQRLSAHAAA